MGLLTTYRRNGQAVATPVSIAVWAGGVYFVTPATSGKARRLTVGAGVTLAPSTVRGRVTGPSIPGRAHLLGADGRRRARWLWQPGGPLFWSYALYRIRGHRMHVYEVRLTEPASNIRQPKPGRMNAAHAYRTVQLTARSSALLFGAAQAASALGPRTGRAPTFLYAGLHGGACRALHRCRDVRQGQWRTRHVSGWAEHERCRRLAHGGRHLHPLLGPCRHRVGRGDAAGARPALAWRHRASRLVGHGRDVRRRLRWGSSLGRGGTPCPPRPWLGR